MVSYQLALFSGAETGRHVTQNPRVRDFQQHGSTKRTRLVVHCFPSLLSPNTQCAVFLPFLSNILILSLPFQKTVVRLGRRFEEKAHRTVLRNEEG